MKKLTGLLIITSLLLASCNCPKSKPENGNGDPQGIAKIPFAPIDVYIFIDAGDANHPIGAAEVTAISLSEHATGNTNACGGINLQLKPDTIYRFTIRKDGYETIENREVTVTGNLKFSLVES